MADIVINPSVGKIDFFTTKGDQSAANSLRLTGTTVLFAGPISASSISTGGGGSFVTSVQPTSNYLSKFTGNSTIANSLVYDNGTNVGIGTTSPADKLHVIGNIRINGGDILNWSGQAFIQTVGASDMFFRPNSTLQMILTAGGNLGIGNGFVNPLAKLHINSTTSGATLLRTDGTSGTLFSVVDDLSDSLMSVNNSAGLPVLEVFADDRIVGGQYGVNDFVVVNNKVGIGTNNPTAKLQVSGSTSTTAAAFLGGNVGIGTTSPAQLLELKKTTGSAIAILNYNDSVKFNINASSTGAGYVGMITNHPLIFVINDAEKVRVDTSGNVGIGTSSPAGKLHIVQNNDVGRYSYFGSNSGLFIKANDNSINSLLVLENTQAAANYGVSINFNLGYGGDQGTAGTSVLGSRIVAAEEQTWTSTSTTQDAFLAFYTTLNGTSGEKVRITSDGNVGIGTTTTTGLLTLNGTYPQLTANNPSTGSGVVIQLKDNGRDAGFMGHSTTTARLQFGSRGSSAAHMTIGEAGNVGIGTTSPTQKLEVQGNIQAGNDSTTTIGFKLTRLLGGVRTSEHTFHSANNSPWYTYGQNLNWTGELAGTVESTQAYRPYFEGFAPAAGYKIFGFMDTSSGAFTSANIVNSLVLKNDGNVGIGTASPGNNLVVYNASSWAGGDLNGSSGGELRFLQSGTLKANIYASTSTGFVINGGSETIFQIGASEKMRLTGANLGIGTTGPGAKLHCYNGSSGGQVSSNSNLISIESNGNNGLQFLNPSANNANINFGDQADNEIGFIQYQHATDAMRFKAGGTTIMSLVSGKVGIGTSSPNNKLDVVGATGTTINMSNSDDGNRGGKLTFISGSATGRQFYVGTNSSIYNLVFGIDAIEKARIDTNGNLGIGTTSPTALLNTAVTGQIQIGTSNWPTTFVGKSGARTLIGNDGVLILWNDTSTIGANVEASLFLGARGSGVNGATTIAGGGIRGLSEDASTNKGYLKFETNGGSGFAEAMRIKSDGNVGIGTSSPEVKLHVRGYQVFLYNDLDTNNTYFYARNSGAGNAGIKMKNSDGEWTIIANDRLRFMDDDAGVERLSILSDGNVGIGTTVPVAKLHLNSTTAAATLLRADGTSGTLFSVVDDLSDSLMSVNNSAGLPVLEVFADDRIVGGQYGQNDLVVVNNKVGIGTNNPLAKLHVTGSASTPAAVFLGDVGIGTTAPTAQSNYRFLQVNGPTSAIIETTVGGTRIGGFDSTSNTLYVGSIGSFPVVFRTAVDEKMRISANGNVGIGTSSPAVKLDVVGNIRTSTGILFGTDTAAANLLDDYEEGTFTVTVGGTTTNGTATYAAQNGFYTKIGRLVQIQIYVSWSAGTATGSQTFLGLPFTSNGTGNNPSVLNTYPINISLTAGYYAASSISSNSSTINLYQLPTGGGGDFSVPCDAAGTLIINGTYFV